MSVKWAGKTPRSTPMRIFRLLDWNGYVFALVALVRPLYILCIKCSQWVYKPMWFPRLFDWNIQYTCTGCICKTSLHFVFKQWVNQWVSLHGWMGFREACNRALAEARFATECSVGISVNSLNTMNTLMFKCLPHCKSKGKHCMRFWFIHQ